MGDPRFDLGLDERLVAERVEPSHGADQLPLLFGGDSTRPAEVVHWIAMRRKGDPLIAARQKTAVPLPGGDRLRRAAEADSASLRDRFALLSHREQQVMQLVSSGKMNKQVAAVLKVSEITVKIHRGSAMRKMGARTLADLVRMAEALGLAR